jgi:threonine synthase
VEYQLSPQLGKKWRRALAERPWGMWRYRELLPVRGLPVSTGLGEGGTPLLTLHRLAPRGVDLLLKEEGGNPTGSFKARGLAMAIHRARELGAPGAQLASAGNAAVALAAYAAAAGLPARVALPRGTPRRIDELCRLHGAEVLLGGATLVESRERLLAAGGDYWDLSTFREPYRVEGKKTMGLELAEQLGWELPDWVVFPTGGGTGVVGIAKACRELHALGLVGSRLPRFAVAQMAGCAPLVAAHRAGARQAEPWDHPETRVWGLRVPRAVADFLILEVLAESDGEAVAVEEEAVAGMRLRAAREEGLLLGPEGAAALLATLELARRGCIRQGERVVTFQTGHPANYGW